MEMSDAPSLCLKAAGRPSPLYPATCCGAPITVQLHPIKQVYFALRFLPISLAGGWNAPRIQRQTAVLEDIETIEDRSGDHAEL